MRPAPLHRRSIAFTLKQIAWLEAQSVAQQRSLSDLVRRVVDAAREPTHTRQGPWPFTHSEPSAAELRWLEEAAACHPRNTSTPGGQSPNQPINLHEGR